MAVQLECALLARDVETIANEHLTELLSTFQIPVTTEANFPKHALVNVAIEIASLPEFLPGHKQGIGLSMASRMCGMLFIKGFKCVALPLIVEWQLDTWGAYLRLDAVIRGQLVAPDRYLWTDRFEAFLANEEPDPPYGKLLTNRAAVWRNACEWFEQETNPPLDKAP